MKYLYLLLALLSALSAQAQITEARKGENKKWGFVDASGKWIIPPKYEYATWYKEGKCGKFSSEESYFIQGAIDQWGKILIPCRYKGVRYYEGYFYIEQELNDNVDLEGVCDMNGKVIIPCKDYTHVHYYDGYFYTERKISKDKTLQGICDLNGKVIIPCRDYTDIIIKDDGTFSVKSETGSKTYQGILDREGKVLISCHYDEVYFNSNDKVYYMTKDGKQGVADMQGKVLIPCRYENIFWYDNYYVLQDGNYHGIATLTGKVIVEPDKYISIIRYDSYYMAKGEKDNSYAILDKNGKEILPLTTRYLQVGYTGEDTFAVCVKGKADKKLWGYWGGGRELVTPQYDQVTAFQGGVATVTKDGQAKLIKNPLTDTGVQIAQGGAVYTKEGKSGPAISRYPAPNSDVDKNIPKAASQSDTKFAFIIANENYPEAPVPYALNDGRIFREYCLRTLGLPEKHVRLYEDATYGNIIAAVEDIKQLAEAYEGEAELIFYYAGHGVPDEKQNSAYLLPVDGTSTDVTATGYPLSKLYEQLSALPLRNVTVFLDACFSGAKREDEMLVSARAVAIKTREEAPRGNMVVFSAATGDETAHQLEEKGHGLFTYYLLKKLQQTSGNVTLGELSEYVTKQVKRQSVVINNKKQTPTTTPSESLTDTWTNKKL